MRNLPQLVRNVGSSKADFVECRLLVSSVRALTASPSASSVHHLSDISASRSLQWRGQTNWPVFRSTLHGVKPFSKLQAVCAMSSLDTCREEADSPTHKQTGSHAGKQANTTNGEHADTQTDKHADGQAVRLTDTQTPDGLRLLGTQVAGHQFGEAGRKVGMLDRGDGLVLKAVQGPPRGPRELNFYKRVFDTDNRDPDILELRNFLPSFYGTDHRDGVEFLVLHNVTFRLPQPNVLDLKMGRVTYDPEATPEKIRQETSKYPPLQQLGFQIIGMMTHHPVTGAMEKLTKQECRSVTEKTMLTHGLGNFFGLGRGGLRKDVVKALLVKLRRLEAWFLTQKQLAFYASSILIVYNSALQEPSGHTLAPTDSSFLRGSSVEEGSDRKGDDRGGASNGAEGVACKRRRLDESASQGQQNTSERDTGAVQEKGHSYSSLQSGPSQKVSSKGEGGSRGSVDLSPDTRVVDQKGLTQGLRRSEGRVPVAGGPSTGRADGEPRTCADDRPLVELRMIDFAHVFPGTGIDQNYLFGLQKLISYLEQLLDM